MATVRPSGDMANPPPNELTGSNPRRIRNVDVREPGTRGGHRSTANRQSRRDGRERRQRPRQHTPPARRRHRSRRGATRIDALLVVEVRARVADIAKPPPDVLDQTAFEDPARAARHGCRQPRPIGLVRQHRR